MVMLLLLKKSKELTDKTDRLSYLYLCLPVMLFDNNYTRSPYGSALM